MPDNCIPTGIIIEHSFFVQSTEFLKSLEELVTKIDTATIQS